MPSSKGRRSKSPLTHEMGAKAHEALGHGARSTPASGRCFGTVLVALGLSVAGSARRRPALREEVEVPSPAPTDATLRDVTRGTFGSRTSLLS